MSKARSPKQANAAQARRMSAGLLLASVVVASLALGLLAASARAAAPFPAGAFPRMKAANAKIETLAKHFLTVSFGTCQRSRSTMPDCVDAAAQPLFKAFPGVHNVLLTYQSGNASTACEKDVEQAEQGNTDEYDDILAVHGALTIDENVAKATRARTKYEAAQTMTEHALSGIYANCR